MPFPAGFNYQKVRTEGFVQGSNRVGMERWLVGLKQPRDTKKPPQNEIKF